MSENEIQVWFQRHSSSFSRHRVKIEIKKQQNWPYCGEIGENRKKWGEMCRFLEKFVRHGLSR